MAVAGYGIVLNAWDSDSVSKTRRRKDEFNVGTYGALQRVPTARGTVPDDSWRARYQHCTTEPL